jgi:glycosyltransferase involved in cell wall biosynthesis
MCKEKGLHTLVEAFIKLHGRKSIPGLQLHVGGSCGPADEPLVNELKSALDRARILPLTRFFPNVTRRKSSAFYSDSQSFQYLPNTAKLSGSTWLKPWHHLYPWCNPI